MNDPASRIWQQLEYEPSTIVSVKIVEEKSPTANCINSPPVRRSSYIQQQESDVHRGTGAVSYQRMLNPMQFSNQVQSQLISGASAVGRQSGRADRTMETQASPRQMMINTRTIPAANRESVLQMLNEELHQQQQQPMAWKTDYNPLLSMQAHTGSLVKPVPVKMQRFHPLMSSPPRVPSSTILPSTAQTTSGQFALPVFHSASGLNTENSATFGSMKQSPGSFQLNVGIDQFSPSCSSDARNPYLSVGISQQPVQFGNPVLSSIGRRHPDAGEELLLSPERQSSISAPATQHTPVASWPTVLGSPVQQYSSPQCAIRSPLNYSSPMFPSALPPCPQSLPLSHTVRPVNLVSRHSSPIQYTAISSPAASFPAICSQGSYNTVYHAASSPSKLVSADLSSPKVNRQMLSTAFSMQQCCSAMSLATPSSADRSASIMGSGVRSEATFRTSYSLPRSATGLRNFRLEGPAASVVVPPLTYSRRQLCDVPCGKQPKQLSSVLPPARLPRHVSKNLPRPTFSQQHSDFAAMYRHGQPSTKQKSQASLCKTADTLRMPATKPRSQANVCKTVDRSSHAPLSCMISPSKFDQVQVGPPDVESYIGKPIAVPQNQTVVKSEGSMLPATSEAATTEAAKPNTKQPSEVRSGVKRKLQWTESKTETGTESKPVPNFAAKFQESLSRQSLFDTSEGDSAENKWPTSLSREKPSKATLPLKRRKEEKHSCITSVLADNTSDSQVKLQMNRKVVGKKKLPKCATADNVKKKYRPFIQNRACRSLRYLLRCRECRSNTAGHLHQCRFFSFRRLRYDQKGLVHSCGFASAEDATGADLDLWMPRTTSTPMAVDTAKYIVSHVGSGFCNLIEQEKSALSWMKPGENIVWKRPVKGIREMCDGCSTTLFNVHWTCTKCGHAVCLDCYNALRHCTHSADGPRCKPCGQILQRCCVSRRLHDIANLVPTQIIPTDALMFVGQKIHTVRRKCKMANGCPCGENPVETVEPESTLESTASCVLAEDAQQCANSTASGAGPETESTVVKKDHTDIDSKTSANSETLCVDSVSAPDNLSCHLSARVLRRRSKGNVMRSVVSLPANVMDCGQPRHTWLDGGHLLQLLDPSDPGNIGLFREHWSRGVPIIVSNCDSNLDKSLWNPEAFLDNFGSRTNDLIDCSRNMVLVGHQMRRFWEGFECVGKRLRDGRGQPMILKLKDWPATEDFAEMLPAWFDNLLQALPLPEYTDRRGTLNLASSLPSFFVRPDLGPKMYNAYGSALAPRTGSTNLHLDISDAVNLMVYVGIPRDEEAKHVEGAVKAMDVAGCCQLSKDRVLVEKRKPGALWHIYESQDSDKIRDLLKKVGDEIGEPVEPNHDPIHDQSWYLDETLRERLWNEYGVRGYTILQCVGDCVFIPAGAPHQVRNLHSCIKAAEDFVSPENLSHCFKLTQEFRYLSDTHSNHEDKLQVKNIIYHTVKDAIAVLDSVQHEDS